MRNSRKQVRPCMDRHTLTLFPRGAPSSQYAKGLVAECNIISMKHREPAWAKKITDAQQRALIRTLTGQILNFKLGNLYTQGRVSSNCPLCKTPDRTSHTVCGGCYHAHMTSRVIKRHDNAVRIVLAAILKGPMGAHAIMADLNTYTFDNGETVGKPVILGGQKIPKSLHLHLLDDLMERTRHALRETADLDKTSTSPNERICKLLHEKYATESESFRDFRLRFHAFSMSFRPDIAIFIESTRSYELWNDTHWQGYVAKIKKNHYRAMICSGRLCGGPKNGKSDAAFAIKIPVARPWLAGAIPYYYTRSNWHNVNRLHCVPKGSSTFTFCTRGNCTIVGPYDVESYAWLGHTASSIR